MFYSLASWRFLSRFLLAGLLAAVLLAVLLFSAGGGGEKFPRPPEGAFAHTWECLEFYTDYRYEPPGAGCKIHSELCGTYCFFANCIKCKDDCHSVPSGGGDGQTCYPSGYNEDGSVRETCIPHLADDHQNCVTDEDGNEVCTPFTERHGVPSCEHWLWHLYFEDPVYESIPVEIAGPERAWKNLSQKPYGDCDVGSHYRATEEPPLPPYDFYEKEFEVPTPREQPEWTDSWVSPDLFNPPPTPPWNKCRRIIGINVEPTDPTPHPSRVPYVFPPPGANSFTSDIHAGVETPMPTLIGPREPLYVDWQTQGDDGAYHIGGMDIRRRIEIEDLYRPLGGQRLGPAPAGGHDDPGGGSLVVIPGEPGAPVLHSVSKVPNTDDEVILSASGDAVEFRYWQYNGSVPDNTFHGVPIPAGPAEYGKDIVPFEPLPADGKVKIEFHSRSYGDPCRRYTGDSDLATVRARGGDLTALPPRDTGPCPRDPGWIVYSFQVRGAGTDAPGCPPDRLFRLPTPTPQPTVMAGCPLRSNVVHQIVGRPELPTPTPVVPPFTPTPEIRPFPGRVAPGRSPEPVLTPRPVPLPDHAERPCIPSRVSAAEIPGSKGDVQLTVFGCTGDLEYRAWTHTSYQPNREDDEYVVREDDDDRWLPAASPRFVVKGLDYPLYWSFQVRSVDSEGVPGEPSDTVNVLVWGGAGVVRSDLRTRVSGMVEVPDRPKLTPLPGGRTPPKVPVIQSVREVTRTPEPGTPTPPPSPGTPWAALPPLVEVKMSPVLGDLASYLADLELRRWLHTGRVPARLYEEGVYGELAKDRDRREGAEQELWKWSPASSFPTADPPNNAFIVNDLPGYPEGFPAMWDFQTRLKSGGLEGEPSDVTSLMVWGELGPSPTPCVVWKHRHKDAPLGDVPCVHINPPRPLTPVPTATPLPTATPEPVCEQSIGTVSERVRRGGTWTLLCESVSSPGSHALYYTFSLPEDAEVQVDLESATGNLVYLLSGHGRDGSLLGWDLNSGHGHNARLTMDLGAGDYTVEAVAGSGSGVGDFILTITPTEDMNCEAGNAVGGADVPWNAGLVADCKVLLEVRDMLAGGGELNWSPVVEMEDWTGVRTSGPLTCLGAGNKREMCSGHARVTALELPGRALSGIVPSGLGGLPELRVLILDRNTLTGSIPPSLGGLSNLRTLSLAYNRLTGPVPPQLGGLGALEMLDLRRNMLSGQVPGQLGNLGSLKYLWLSYNMLSGSVPAALAGISGLTGLHLGENGITGCIPDVLKGVRINDYRVMGLQFCDGTWP